jgi:hypothetical protein
MNAVWTTFGCCAAAAAPTAGPDVPFVVALSGSVVLVWFVPFLSAAGLLKTGGPIEGTADGVISIGSRGGVSVADAVDEGSIGMDLCIP